MGFHFQMCLKKRNVLVVALLLLFSKTGLYAFSAEITNIPANDDCGSASAITISDAGFGKGVFLSEVVDVTEATTDKFEYFDPVQISAVTNKKSVWFSFFLPTAREITLELKQPGIDIASDGAGFTTYYTNNCIAGEKEIVAAKLTPVNKFGSTYNPCLDPGHYLVQVSTRADANGPVFLKLTVGYPFQSEMMYNVEYDNPTDAFDFGLIDTNEKSVTYDFGCHSIDNQMEIEGLPVSNPESYTQSTWHVFRTDDYFDVFSIIVEQGALGAIPPEHLIFKMYEGDVRQKPVSSLKEVEPGTLMTQMGNKRVVEYLCNAVLKPQTSYTFQLAFPSDYHGDNIRVRIAQWGERPAGAVSPVKEQVKKTNILGVLPINEVGTTTHFNDFFACNAFVRDNACGMVQNGDVVAINKRSFDVAVWVFFELSESADIKIKFSEDTPPKFVRLFSKGVSNKCGDIIPSGKEDLFARFNRNYNKNCVPPGKYSMQILGNSAPEDPNTPYGDGSVLGRPIDLTIEVSISQGTNKFSLSTPSAVDSIYQFQPLPDGEWVLSESDTFSCGSTIIPDGIDCGKPTKASYRIFEIGDGNKDGIPDSGFIQIHRINTNKLNYAIFHNDLSALVSAQLANRSSGTIYNPDNYLDGCVTNTAPDLNFYCITPGRYTLPTLAGANKIGYSDQPHFRFKILRTKYASRTNAEDLGDITPKGHNALLSNADTFSCLSNPETIGGLKPEGSKLIYRQFYLDESKIVRIQSPTGHKLNLFRGQARDLTAPLEPWDGKNMQYMPWESGFVSQTTHPCYPLIPGWYTVVSYGEGPSYQNPSMHGTDGMRGDAGSSNTISISLTKLYEEPCDCPSKACLVNNGNPIAWDLAARSDDYPNTSDIFYFDTTYFGCTPDTPWTNHPVEPCDPNDLWVLYYVFKLGEPSFVSIKNIPSQLSTKIYPFDVRTDSTRMIASDPTYPCSGPDVEERQICNLQAGTYTLVIFSGPGDPYFVAPVLYVERVDKSRFDNARKAYDFGSIPPDNKIHWGKVGDSHPSNPNVAASSDIIFCSTGAQPTDPTDGICGGVYSPNTYSSKINNVMLNQYASVGDGTEMYTLRNLWYTFVLDGTGNASVTIDHFPDTSSMYRPLISLYQSDVDGTIPFTQLVSQGGVDSTLEDGLTFLKCNRDSLCTGSRSKTLHFKKSECTDHAVRYYILISMWNTLEPNQQVSISLQYDGAPINGVKYDHYSTANRIGHGDQTNTSLNDIIGEGIYKGAPARLECATRDPGDPLQDSNYSRSVWYKFTTGSSGYIRLAHESDGNPDNRSASSGMKLYREIVSGDSTSLIEVDMKTVDLKDPESHVIHVWQQGTCMAGTYYIFWSDIAPDFDLFKTYSPVIWITENPGDFCYDAVQVNINGVGISAGSLTIDAHTIGTDFGEDGSNMGCLSGPEGYKSSWFKLNIHSDKKLDVTFDIMEKTTATADQVLYRIMYGDCSAMTAGPCNNNANTMFSLTCMAKGDNYFIQVVSPDTAKGEILLEIHTEETIHQECVPINPLKPVANFDAAYDCYDPKISFLNKSSQGDNIEYLWEFPDGQTSTEFSPDYIFSQADSTSVITVSLTVMHKHFGTSDHMSKFIAIPPAAIFNRKDTLVCANEPFQLDVSMPRAEYLWHDGSNQPIFDVQQSGLYWVEINAFDCIRRDSIFVEFYLCNLQIVDTSLCAGSSIHNQIIRSDTVIQMEKWTSPTDGFMVQYNIEVLESYLVHQAITICEGEELVIGNSVYNSSGIYTDVFPTRNGCDSTIITNLTVNKLPSPEIVGATYFCKGSSTVLEVRDQFDTYTWLQTGQTTPSIEVFSEGTYQVVVTDRLGCSGTTSIDVHPPLELKSSADIHLKPNGNHISCAGAADGEVDLSVSGGQAPYKFVWSNGLTTQTATELSAGNYSGTVTDKTGCSTSFDFVLEDAPAMSLGVSVLQPVCFGEENGSIQVDVRGVTGPCEFSVNDGPFQNENIFDHLDAGTHEIYVMDASGCDAQTSFTLEETQPIITEIMPSQAELNLGKSLDIQVLLSGNGNYDISWQPTSEMDCESCEVITVKPMENTMYKVHVTDENNCTETAYSEIKVMKNRNVFVPNSFTPNNDGLNDRFTVFSGSDIENIRQFKVFDRWGSLVFNTQNIPPNEESIGWDGTVNGQQLPSAVYIYFAEVEYIDHHRELIKGDVTLIR